MKRKKILTVMILALVALGGVFGTFGRALAKRAISLSPTTQRIILTPGETFTSGFSIVNPNDADSNLDYLATIGSFSYGKDEDGKYDYSSADFNTISDLNEIMNWTKIDNPTGVIAPNESRTLSYTIKVPENAPAGGQYMTILVKENNKETKDAGTSGVNEVMEMAFIVYAEVTGDTVREGSIEENNIPAFLLGNKLEATSIVRNNGNIHTDAEYVLQVWPLFSDEEVCTNEENPETSLIMPGSERYHVQSCELPMVGVFKAKQIVRIFGEVSEVEHVIVVCPLWLIFIIIFIIVALIIWIVARVKARKNAEE